MDRWHGDEHLQVLTASVQDVCQTLGNPASWDADGHDALFWAKRLGDADFFANLGPADLSLIHIWRCRRIERCKSRGSPYH